jgi:hypothetical protein
MVTSIKTYSPAIIASLAASLMRPWDQGRFHTDNVTLAGRSVR